MKILSLVTFLVPAVSAVCQQWQGQMSLTFKAQFTSTTHEVCPAAGSCVNIQDRGEASQASAVSMHGGDCVIFYSELNCAEGAATSIRHMPEKCQEGQDWTADLPWRSDNDFERLSWQQFTLRSYKVVKSDDPAANPPTGRILSPNGGSIDPTKPLGSQWTKRVVKRRRAAEQPNSQ